GLHLPLAGLLQRPPQQRLGLLALGLEAVFLEELGPGYLAGAPEHAHVALAAGYVDLFEHVLLQLDLGPGGAFGLEVLQLVQQGVQGLAGEDFNRRRPAWHGVDFESDVRVLPAPETGPRRRCDLARRQVELDGPAPRELDGELLAVGVEGERGPAGPPAR